MKALTWPLFVALLVGATAAHANANDELAEKLYAVKALTGLGVNYNDYSARVQTAVVARDKAERTEGVNSHLNLAALHYTFVYERWHLSNGFSTPALKDKADKMNVEDWERAAHWLSRYEEEKSTTKKAKKTTKPKNALP